MAQYAIHTSEINDCSDKLNAGDRVLLSGTIYTARDAAHKRIKDCIDNNKELPFDLKNSIIYYAGPTPTPKNLAIGSCGPTTSGRMDNFTPAFLDLGLKAMIGKGPRSDDVFKAITRNKAVYFCAVGGAGALMSKCIVNCEVIAFNDLGCESVKKLEIKDLPLIVAIDCNGGSLFK